MVQLKNLKLSVGIVRQGIMRTCKFYLYEYKFSNARPLPAHFVTTEVVGSHY